MQNPKIKIYRRVNEGNEDSIADVKIFTIGKKVNTGNFELIIWIEYQKKIPEKTLQWERKGCRNINESEVNM
jgi:hypothetical protein